jgi:O-succinylbenzoic acid--CoA ligase
MIEDYILKGCNENPNKVFITAYNVPISYYDFNINVIKFISLIEPLSNAGRLFIDLDDSMDILYALNACNRLSIVPVIPPDRKNRIKGVDYYQISKSTNTLNNSCTIQSNKNNNKYNFFSYDSSLVQCVVFTSGTESNPKAVELTFNNIYSSVLQWSGVLEFKKNDIYINILPLYHISGLSIFFRCLYFDMHHIIEKYVKKNFLINKQDISYISIVPKIINDARSSSSVLQILKNINSVIVGGDSINKSTFDFCKNNKINAYISYGMTETASGVSGYFIKNQYKYDEGYIGDVHEGNEVKIMNRVITIKSQSVMKSYTSFKNSDGIFITSDYGIKINNKLYCKGRKSNFIISGGENVNLNNIKKIISLHPNIDDLVVTSIAHNIWGAVPVLLYSSNQKDNSIKDIRIFCKNNLPDYMVPHHMMQVDKIPYKNNKIDFRLVDFYIKESLQ